MRAYIKHHQLPAFRSIKEDKERIKQLDLEIPKIEKQLHDPTRVLRSPSIDAYEEWEGKAKRALALFVEEHRLRTARIEHELFRQAYELLLKLETEVDFEDDEQALMEQLDDHFLPPNMNRQQQTA